MKKLFPIISVLGLLWCNIGFAGPKTIEDAKEYFFKNRKNLDPIEGIWYDAESNIKMRQTSAIYKVGEGLYSRWIIENSVPRLEGTHDGPSNGSIRGTASNKVFKVKSTWIRDVDNPRADFISHGNIIMEGINVFEETHRSFTQIWFRIWGDKLVKKTDSSKPKNKIIKSSGTAFFINSKGYLLTNNHVVEGCKLQKIKYKGKDYDANILATDKTLDLALMKVDVTPKSYFRFSKSSPEKLQKIYVAGYPFGKGLSDDLKISSGIVSSVKGYDDNSNEFQVDAPINPGNSGGPIVDDTGELIGIAVAGLAKDKAEGINFGIKSLSAVTFLKTNNIDPETSIMTFGMNNKKLLQLLEESTVYTYCN